MRIKPEQKGRKNTEVKNYEQQKRNRSIFGRSRRTSTRKNRNSIPVREKMKAEFDTLYQGYIIEGYNEGIEGEYGVSTAVNMVDTNNDGRRVTLWVGGYETNHFAQFIEGQAATVTPFLLQYLS